MAGRQQALRNLAVLRVLRDRGVTPGLVQWYPPRSPFVAIRRFMLQAWDAIIPHN